MLGIINEAVYDAGEFPSVADASPPTQSELMRILKRQAISSAESARDGDWNADSHPYVNWLAIIYDAMESRTADMLDYLLFPELWEPIPAQT